MRALALAALLLVASCLPLARVAASASWLGSVIDAAESAAAVYLARHPSAEVEQSLAVAVKRARLGVLALKSAALAGSENDAAKARAEALEAYRALRELLVEAHVLDAAPAIGGAETSAPMPEPVELPSGDEVAARL